MAYNIKLKDFNIKEQAYTIDSTEKCFEGTELFNTGFTVTVQTLNKEESRNLLYSYQNNEGAILLGSYEKQLFISCVIAITGFTLDNKEVELDSDFLGTLHQHSRAMGMHILKERIEEVYSRLEEQKAEKKITQLEISPDMQDGQ
ncbi:MAG: hypothetical protein JJV88_05120 [Sulfurovum sp.]|nr:hypothetical protein [Sulfurovaceae bacterium]